MENDVVRREIREEEEEVGREVARDDLQCSPGFGEDRGEVGDTESKKKLHELPSSFPGCCGWTLM